MENKYTVLKNDDLNKYHTSSTIEFIERAGDAINERRISEGKNVNTYIVINTVEPYASEVIDILKRNGHLN